MFLQLLVAVDWLYTTLIHTLSVGDGLLEAPGALLIQPKVEPVSEDIKYRLFNLDIAEADLHICEEGSIMRLQSAGLDLEFCNFHSGDETLGLSWQLQGLTVSCLLPDPQEPSLYLRVGLVDCNTVQGDLSMREPMDCVPERQLTFLRMADARTHRLWFLWREGDGARQCGCCGGCLFMHGSVARKPVISRPASAVYRPHFSPLTSIPRHLAMQGLNDVLQGKSMCEVDTLWCLHRGLLGHYQARYADKQPPATHTPLITPSLHEDRLSKGLSFSDDASFVSARSSLTSLLGEEYKSVSDIHMEVTEEHVALRTRHRKKPSNLSIDVRTEELGKDSTDFLHGGYHGVLGSQFLHTATLQIPHHTPTKDLSPHPGVGHHPPSAGVGHAHSAKSAPFAGVGHTPSAKPAPVGHTPSAKPAPVGHAHSAKPAPSAGVGHTPSAKPAPSAGVGFYRIHHRRSASDASYLISDRHTPDATAPSCAPFHVFVPCLAPEAAAALPVLTQKTCTQTLERRRKVYLRPAVSDSGEDADMAKFSFSVRICGANTVLLSPPSLSIITR